MPRLLTAFFAFPTNFIGRLFRIGAALQSNPG